MMRAVRSACIALLLLVAGVIFAPQAFATLRLTTSTGTAAVTPFVTPIGNTTASTQIGTSTDARLSLGGFEVSCSSAALTSYVGATHTELRVIAVAIGNGMAGSCRTTGGGRVDGEEMDTVATSINPWHLHFRTNNSVTRSAIGTLNNSSALTFRATSLGESCEFIVSAQSIDATYTYMTTSLVVSDSTVVTAVRPVVRGGVCPASGNATILITYTLTFGTNNHRLTVTGAS
jgi:hypothetical protein